MEWIDVVSNRVLTHSMYSCPFANIILFSFFFHQNNQTSYVNILMESAIFFLYPFCSDCTIILQKMPIQQQREINTCRNLCWVDFRKTFSVECFCTNLRCLQFFRKLLNNKSLSVESFLENLFWWTYLENHFCRNSRNPFQHSFPFFVEYIFSVASRKPFLLAYRKRTFL